MKNRKKKRKKTNFFPKKFFDVKKSKFANRLKRALPKFRGDRSEVRGVNGRSKFVAASAGRAERKNYLNTLDTPSTLLALVFFIVFSSLRIISTRCSVGVPT